MTMDVSAMMNVVIAMKTYATEVMWKKSATTRVVIGMMNVVSPVTCLVIGMMWLSGELLWLSKELLWLPRELVEGRATPAPPAAIGRLPTNSPRLIFPVVEEAPRRPG
jgi:hypothetical protein